MHGATAYDVVTVKRHSMPTHGDDPPLEPQPNQPRENPGEKGNTNRDTGERRDEDRWKKLWLPLERIRHL